MGKQFLLILTQINKMKYHVYNTGDQIWMSERYGQQIVVKIISSDGLVLEEGDDAKSTLFTRRMSGAEKYIHMVQTFIIKLILKVLK